MPLNFICSPPTLHLTDFLTDLMVASQNAPLNFALTGVPTSKKAGMSLA